MELFPFFINFEPTVGIEPTTYSLPWSCSATELRWHELKIYKKNAILAWTLPLSYIGDLNFMEQA